MIKVNTISAESATVSSQALSSQGITAKGGKGKKSLFSKLLATLGQATHKQTANTSAKSEDKLNTIVLNPEQQKKKITSKQTNLVPQNPKEKKGVVVEDAESPTNQNIHAITVIHAPIDIQNLSKARNQTHVLTAKAESSQITIAQSKPLATPQDIQKSSISTLKPLIGQKTANVILNTIKQVNDDQQQPVVLGKESPENLISNINVTKQNVQEASKITPPFVQNKFSTTVENKQAEPKIGRGIPDVTPTKVRNISNQTKSTQANTAPEASTAVEFESLVKAQEVTQATKVEPKVEKLQGQTTTETQLAALAKAPNAKVQTNQSVEQAGVTAVSATSSSKIADLGSNTSQQDFTSDQQDLSGLNIDAHKQDTKLKGADFQAQLAYKSQRAFTPADAMLEIVKSAKDGSTTLELQLEPAHLGKVQVQIQMDAAKNIQVAFTVDQQTSRQALEQHMPQLRLALSQQGLDLGSFSMQMNQQQHQEHQSPHSASNTSTWTNQNNEDQTQNNKIGINIATDGRLSILA